MDAVFEQVSGLALQAVDFLPRLVLALFVFLLSLLVAKLAGRAVERATRNADTLVASAQYPNSSGGKRLVRIGIVIKATSAGRNCDGE